MSQYSGFYKKSREERVAILESTTQQSIDSYSALTFDTANHLVENAITTFELPMGIAPNFLINKIEHVVPMVTEEPSVIAAASNGAKIIRENGGFTARIIERTMQGEIVFMNPKDPDLLIAYVSDNQCALNSCAQNAHPSIVKRGGGVTRYETRSLYTETDMCVIVDVFVDTQEAMGANIINTILEALRSQIESETQTHALMAILTNYTPYCVVEVACSVAPHTLKHGADTIQRIHDASTLASMDSHRCATHNKGVMNGIDAVVLATGNDTRAVNAAMYSYASKDGILQPFTSWRKHPNGNLVGTAIVSLPLGSVGGSIGSNPKVQLAHDILKFPNVETLTHVVAATGLAQNFAALYALTTDGIQKGHMSLHARNIALSVGVHPDEMTAFLNAFNHQPVRNKETASQVLHELRNVKGSQ